MSDVAPTPLSELRVVEISDRIAGGYCGKLLVDAGADVVKVEPVAGDPLRRFTATGAVPAAGADSPLFSYLNAGKRSVTTLSDELLARADVVIITATRSAAIGRGFDPQALLDASPRSVVVTVSDFGWTGPWSDRPATEFTLQAWSGLTGFRGDPAGPPISIGGELGEYMGGACAAYGALALWRRVRRGGAGGHLDMSLLESITLMQSGEWLHSQLLQVPPIRRSVEVPSIEAGGRRLCRHQHGDRTAVARLRRHGGMPGIHRDPGSSVPDRAVEVPRLDPGAHRAVDARAHRRRDRRTRPAVPAADRARSATVRRSRRWITSASAASSSRIRRAFGNRAPPG